jgi:hypothetical protein
MRRILILTVCIALLAAPARLAFASSETVWPEPNPNLNPKPALPPKPLLAAPNPPSAPAPDSAQDIDPKSGLPKDLTEMRTKNRADFRAWFKDDQEIQQQCQNPQGAVARAQCDQKKKISQAKYDAIHIRMLEISRKIDFWRRRQAGLPPPDWWPPENQPIQQPSSNDNNNNSSPNSAVPQKDNSVLLPSESAPLPANTF